MDTEAFGAVTHRRVLEAEAGGAALRVVGVQVEVTQFTPDGHKGTTIRAAQPSPLKYELSSLTAQLLC